MIQLKSAFFAACLLMGSGGFIFPVRAASFTWNTSMTFANDADVSTNGSLVYASGDSVAAATVNTVPFAGSFSSNVSVSGLAGSDGSSFADVTSAPWSGLDSNYQTVLEGGI